MNRHIIAMTLLAPVVLLVACQAPPRSEPAGPALADEVALDHGYALLYATISDESQVDKVLIIKNPDAPVADLLKAIARFATTAKNRLEALSKEEPMIALQNQGLPVVEASTREAISDTTSKGIVFGGGRKFEFRILLTQHQALDYVTHLADTLGKREPREDRRQYLEKLASDARALHERVIALLESPYVGQERR